MSQFTKLKTRYNLVTALIIPQFLYCDVIFSKLTSARLRERLKITFNSWVRYIYGISRFEHISDYSNQIGVVLDLYYSYRICCTMNTIIKSGCPRYLYTELQFGQSSHRFNLIIPAHRLNRSAPSFLIQGAMLWNDLPPEVKREGSIGKFWEKCHIYADW
jgi:hypothetical protein